MHKYISWILSHNKGNMICLAVLILLFGYYGKSVTMDNRMEVWLPAHSDARIQYEKFLEEFSSEEFILIAFQLPVGLTRDHLNVTQHLTSTFEQEKGIKKVWSLTNIFDKPVENFAIVKDIILKSSFCRSTLIAHDGNMSGMLLLLSQEGIRNRKALVWKIKKLVSEEIPRARQAFVAGPPVINVELDQLSQKVSLRYSPVLFFVCLVALLLLFRSLAGVAVPALMMGCSLVLTIGWMGICKASLNTITVACFPLILVISLAYALYFFTAYQKGLREVEREPLHHQRRKALVCAFNSVFLPIFLSALTTAVGFSSLMVSDITPVKHLGQFVAIGTLSTLFYAMTFLPSMLMLFPSISVIPQRDIVHDKLQKVLQTVGTLATRERKLVLFFCTIILVMALIGIRDLRTETHILTFFKKDSLLRQTYEFIERNFTGLSPIEIVIESKQKNSKETLLTTETLRKIKALQKYLGQQEGVVNTQSILDIAEDKTKADLLDLLFMSKEPLFRALDEAQKEFFNEEKTATRISVRAKTLGSDAYRELIGNINSYLAIHFHNGLDAYTTGIVPVIVDMQDTLVKNLIRSFSIALVVICGIFFLLLRSVKNTLISMIPNLVPIVGILGFMGWFNIDLNVATVMIASIALGIAVDDTIHFIFRYRQQSLGASEYVQPVLSTLSSTGKAIVLTSLVTLCGFLTLCFSDFKPISYFGLLSGVTIIAALIGDLVLLPALLVMGKVKFTNTEGDADGRKMVQKSS